MAWKRRPDFLRKPRPLTIGGRDRWRQPGRSRGLGVRDPGLPGEPAETQWARCEGISTLAVYIYPQGAKQPQDADGGRGSCCCRGKVGAPRSGGAELSSSREEGGPRPAAPRGSQKNLGTVNTFKPSPSGAQKGGASQAGGVLASPEEEEASWRHVLSSPPAQEQGWRKGPQTPGQGEGDSGVRASQEAKGSRLRGHTSGCRPPGEDRRACSLAPRALD